MIKAIVLLARKDGMSREEFARYYQEQHRPLLVKLPGLRRLVVNHVLPDPNRPEPAYDAVAEDWFDDPAAMGAAFASPEGQAIIADAPNFLDMSRFQLLVAEEDEVPLTQQLAASGEPMGHRPMSRLAIGRAPGRTRRTQRNET